MFLSLLHPRVLRSLLLIEPFIYEIEDGSNLPMMALTAKKKDVWPDRATAIKKAGPMFQIWDPRVMERWVKYGYRELPTVLYPDSKTPGAVTLATSKKPGDIFIPTRGRKAAPRARPVPIPGKKEQ